MDKKRALLLLAVFIILVLLLGIIYWQFLYSKICGDKTCFNDALANCKKASFRDFTGEANWEYEIQGKNGENCKVYVELLQLKKGDAEMSSLEGKSMVCSLPYSIIVTPQQELDKCHGLLKEEIQQVLIKKMHSYLLENIGEVSKEFQNVI